jgi:hypothetical protein
MYCNHTDLQPPPAADAVTGMPRGSTVNIQKNKIPEFKGEKQVT